LKFSTQCVLNSGRPKDGNPGRSTPPFPGRIAEAGDNPTLGLILCTDKNDSVVRFVLGNDSEQVFARRYQLHLPTEEQLRAELERELASMKQIRQPRRSSPEKG
jgi:hypothetical protein